VLAIGEFHATGKNESGTFGQLGYLDSYGRSRRRNVESSDAHGIPQTPACQIVSEFDYHAMEGRKCRKPKTALLLLLALTVPD
jgi:hypothetical protein